MSCHKQWNLIDIIYDSRDSSRNRPTQLLEPPYIHILTENDKSDFYIKGVITTNLLIRNPVNGRVSLMMVANGLNLKSPPRIKPGPSTSQDLIVPKTIQPIDLQDLD